jgi:biopolymer transport protein ExbB/TolQ
MDGGLLSLLNQGGFAIYPLLLCSVLGVAVIFERVYYLRKAYKTLNFFYPQLAQLIEKGELAKAKSVSTSIYLGELYSKAVELQGNSEEKFLRGLERVRFQLVQQLRHRVWILGTIGSLAPFIGLFGTVIGIMQAFEEIARTQEGGFTTVSAGISEALIATAAGIFVGVVAVVAYNTFSNQINQLALRLKVISEELAEVLSLGEINEKALLGGRK